MPRKNGLSVNLVPSASVPVSLRQVNSISSRAHAGGNRSPFAPRKDAACCRTFRGAKGDQALTARKFVRCRHVCGGRRLSAPTSQPRAWSRATVIRLLAIFCNVREQEQRPRSTPSRIRTCDLLIRNQLLYPLSYRGICPVLVSSTDRGLHVIGTAIDTS